MWVCVGQERSRGTRGSPTKVMKSFAELRMLMCLGLTAVLHRSALCKFVVGRTVVSIIGIDWLQIDGWFNSQMLMAYTGL